MKSSKAGGKVLGASFSLSLSPSWKEKALTSRTQIQDGMRTQMSTASL